jgi:hypothetical protein
VAWIHVLGQPEAEYCKKRSRIFSIHATRKTSCRSAEVVAYKQGFGSKDRVSYLNTRWIECCGSGKERGREGRGNLAFTGYCMSSIFLSHLTFKTVHRIGYSSIKCLLGDTVINKSNTST